MGVWHDQMWLLMALLVAQVSIAQEATVPLFEALQGMALTQNDTKAAVEDSVNQVVGVVAPTAIPSTGPVGEVVISTIDTVNSTAKDGVAKDVTISGLETLLTVLTTLRCAGGRCEVPSKDIQEPSQDPLVVPTPSPTAPATAFTTHLYGKK